MGIRDRIDAISDRAEDVWYDVKKAVLPKKTGGEVLRDSVSDLGKALGELPEKAAESLSHGHAPKVRTPFGTNPGPALRAMSWPVRFTTKFVNKAPVLSAGIVGMGAVAGAAKLMNGASPVAVENPLSPEQTGQLQAQRDFTFEQQQNPLLQAGVPPQLNGNDTVHLGKVESRALAGGINA